MLVSSSGFDELTGGDGNDRLMFNGVGGAAWGGTGIDTLVGDYSARSDAFLFNGIDGHAAFGDDLSVKGNHLYFIDIERLNLTTGSGNDTIIATGLSLINVHSGAGDDRVEGGNGDDQIFAGDGRDILFGGGGGDFILGGFGDDEIDGGNGNDEILGEEGNDSLLGGRGDDRMDGGAGVDRFPIYSDGSIGTLDGGEGFDRADVDFDDVPAGFAFNASRYASIEAFDFSVRSAYRGVQLYGGGGDDTLISYDTYREGPSGNDVLNGRGGDDVLFGGSGADSLIGGDGDDTLRGDSGSDGLLGGVGSDLLAGGTGADTFIWDDASFRNDGNVDRITDFNTEGWQCAPLSWIRRYRNSRF